VTGHAPRKRSPVTTEAAAVPQSPTMKIYTKTGDAGTTALLSGGRVAKSHPRLDSYGTLDELNSVIGILRCEPLPDGVDAHLEAIQRALFSVGAALADPEGRYTQGTDATWEVAPLENWIDAMEEELPKLKRFILPGGSRAAALAHQARTVCRRGERRVAELESTDEPTPDGVLPYLNRLSDAFFVLARFVNRRFGHSDLEWSP
jgi:cob(I)alamin adenosyltransferase